jgi:uncharacterized protein (DUF58 family)
MANSSEKKKKKPLLPLFVNNKSRNFFLGSYQSYVKSSGIEPKEVREYTPSDDPRYIDWNLTARMQQPFVKCFNQEHNHLITILLDTSASMLFGKKDQSPWNKLQESASLIGYSALQNQDNVSIITFDGSFIQLNKKQDSQQLLHTIANLIPSKESKNDITSALTLALSQKKRGALFIISDFLFSIPDQQLKQAAYYFDTTAINLPSSGFPLPLQGLTNFKDLETHETYQQEINPSIYTKLSVLIEKKHASWKKIIQKNKGDFLTINHNDSSFHSLLKYFKSRKRWTN